MDASGSRSCFYHADPDTNGVNRVVHSVFDIDFDQEVGAIRVDSIINDGKYTQVTSYASPTTTSVGELAVQATRYCNAYSVYRALRQAISDHVVVQETEINEEQWAWNSITGKHLAWSQDELTGYIKLTLQQKNLLRDILVTDNNAQESLIREIMGDNNTNGKLEVRDETNSSGVTITYYYLYPEYIKALENAGVYLGPASKTTINEYNYYSKLKDASANPKEQEKEVVINGTSYVIAGPFKMTFGGKGISNITAGSATWTSSESTDIYWSSTISETASWSTDFNAATSGQFVLNNRSFYLAINKSKLPTSGDYTITVKQETFTFYKSRTIVCTGAESQQMGMFCISKIPTIIDAQLSWNLERQATKDLEIIKVDEKTGNELTGAAFKIYAELNDGTNGWVSGTAAGAKTYGTTASEYSAKETIKGLIFGTYYLYEVKAPNGYELNVQDGYHEEAPGSSSLTGDWVYVGNVEISSSSTATISVTIKNRPLTSTQVIKQDQLTGEELTGAKFKIYAELNDGTNGWVSGTAEGTKTYGTTATEYSPKENIKNLEFGTYYIYEVAAPDGYDLTEQDGYHQTAPGSSSLTGDWVYLGTKELDETYTNDAPFTFTIPNKKLATMQIIKIDATTQMTLQGGKFKLYAVLDKGGSGWVSGDADGDKTYGSTATEYTSGVEINKLKYGTYYIYETEGPEGYDLTKQDGYHQEAEGSSSLTGDWVFLGTQVLNVNFPTNGVFEFTATNKKIVDEIEGFVWIDNPDAKVNVNDNIYNSQSNDNLKEGIVVNLYDRNEVMIATTTTDSEGHYSFKTKNAPSYTGTDTNIYYWELANAYVEFIYNNKTTYNEENGTVIEYGYVAVDPFVGTDISINSKAQEHTITTERLDDNNLTGTTGNNPGRAITYRSEKIYAWSEILANTQAVSSATSDSSLNLAETPLTGYYDNETYKISDINLGLLEQHDPEFVIDETLAYIKVKMKGYTYTYRYGDAAATTSTNVPTVNEQTSARTFTAKIYPTDIAYNIAESAEELQVYVVYSIDVKNLETTYIDDKYVEERLYLDSLVNSYDTARYLLCTNENNSDNSDFALWKEIEDGTASYDINNGVYKDGLGKLETKTSYIQFKLKEEALRKILTNGLTYEDIENAPTVATANGYHEYLRTDNAWKHSEDVRAFEGCKGLSLYPTSNDSGEKYYVHKSISKEYQSADLYLKLSLGEARTISGTVFEDIITDESVANNTNLGNGILDSSETNRAQNVTVELLNADKTTVSKLYQEAGGSIVYDENGELPDASTKTEVGGTYTFVGVVPGYYYVRFTYGNGEQIMMPASSQIYSNDYKSTIINTADNDSIIKNALEASDVDIQNAQQTLISDYTNEDAKKLVEWYKYLTQSYSTAVDDLSQRILTEGYSYAEDGSVYDESGNLVTGYPTNVNSYTPMLGISIENDINNYTDNGDYHASNYQGFNFGIIKQADTILKLEKMITNVAFTTQTGTTILSTNPADRTSTYVTALDNIAGGSKYTKIEIDPSLIYGSELETQYRVTIKNETAIEYIEDEGSNEFGYYYKYGQITTTSRLSKIKINEVVDELDEKYDYRGTTDTTVTITEEDDGSISIKGWTEIASQESTSVEYKASSLLTSNDDDTIYLNEARITSLSLDKLSNLNSKFEWGENLRDKTTLTITPTTGEDRSNIYWIAGTIALVTLAVGFMVLKKKVLK